MSAQFAVTMGQALRDKQARVSQLEARVEALVKERDDVREWAARHKNDSEHFRGAVVEAQRERDEREKELMVLLGQATNRAIDAEDQAQLLKEALSEIREVSSKAWTKKGDHTMEVFGDIAGMAEAALGVREDGSQP
jgi:uncharacterized coiled-coil DUF342 family protein